MGAPRCYRLAQRPRVRTDKSVPWGSPVPFPILAILLVLLIAALLFVAYYLTRR